MPTSSRSKSFVFPKYFAEFAGTFVLSYLVLVSLADNSPLSTPLTAALTLGLFVYALGAVSGAHFNPAVTVSMLSINRIKATDALLYLVAQFLGAAAAMGLASTLLSHDYTLVVDSSMSVGIAEAMGTAFLSFAVATVTMKKVEPAVNGWLIGGCLLLGITVALPFSNGVLNPAVALAIGSFGVTYIVGPVIGGIFGAFVASYVHGEKVQFGK